MSSVFCVFFVKKDLDNGETLCYTTHLNTKGADYEQETKQADRRGI